MPRCGVGLELRQIRPTVPHLAHHGRAIELHPGGGTAQGMHEPLQMGFPYADLEVEIMLPVAAFGRRGRRLRRGGGGWWGRRADQREGPAVKRLVSPVGGARGVPRKSPFLGPRRPRRYATILPTAAAMSKCFPLKCGVACCRAMRARRRCGASTT